MYRSKLWTLLSVAGLAACGGGGGLDTPAPTTVEKVATGGFEEPMDAVASPDGRTFFFSAHSTSPEDELQDAALFSVSSEGGAVELLHLGAPLQDPTGLLMSCDGGTVFIADIGAQDAFDADIDEVETAPIYTMDVATKTVAILPTTGIGEAASLAFNTDCSSLYASGYTPEGEPALFVLSPDGGQAEIVVSGAPLVSPSGVFVDTDDIAWVMDQRPDRGEGGALFAIEPDGTTTSVVDGLTISEPAGVSLTAGGRTAVIPSRDEEGAGQLLTVHIDTGEMTVVQPDVAEPMLEPAGIRTARQAPIMVVVDTDGDAIYAAK